MPSGLVRYQHCGDQHFLTFSCFQRLPYLQSAAAKELFEQALEQMRCRHRFVVFGYVVMPEHLHLLVNEPRLGVLSRAVQAMKLSVATRRQERPFWQPRYYDFNVFTTAKHVEKLRYLHRNPVTRGLVEKPEDWPWSSYRHYAAGAEGTVQIESFWSGWKREHGAILPQVPTPGTWGTPD